MAGNYQTADEWLKQKYGSAGAAGTKQSGNYQTAEEWMQQRQQGNSTTSNEQIHQAAMSMSWARRYNKLQNRISEGSFSWDDAVDEVNSLIRGYNGGNGIRGALDEESIQDFDGAYQNLLDMQKSQEFQAAVRKKQYQNKYIGKRYSEISEILPYLEDEEEKQWLSAYQDSVKQKSDTEREYSERLDELKKVKNLADTIEAMRNSRFGVDGLDDMYDSQIAALLMRNGYESYDVLKNHVEKLKKDVYRLKNEEQYRYLEQNEDFAEKSQAVPDKKTSSVGIALGTSWHGAGDAKFDYINDIDGYRKKFAGFAGTGRQGNSPYAIYDYMKDAEVAKYNYLHNTKGEKAANKYLDYLKYDLDERKTRDVEAGYEQYATKHPVIASAASVPANLMSGIGYLNAAGQYVGNKFREGLTGEYRPVNYNTGAMYPTVATTTIRGTVSQNIADKTGTIRMDENKHPFLGRLLNGKNLGEVYQLGMSMADSAAVALLTPVIGEGGLALLGGSAASQGMVDALERGATDEQAITMGLLNGAFETIFEKVSLENLLKNYARTPLKAFLSQMLAEGSEEFNTTLANDVADLLVMAGKSEYRQNIQKYRQQGLDEETATKYAMWEKAVGLAWDAIGGAVSGGIMGPISAPIERQIQSAGTKSVYGSSQNELINKALELNPDNKYAQKMQKKASGGKKLSSIQLYNLIAQNESVIADNNVSTIKNAAGERLTQLGETGNVELISSALAKLATGNQLTLQEKQAIKHSSIGDVVAREIVSGEIWDRTSSQELDTENIQKIEGLSLPLIDNQDVTERADIIGEEIPEQAEKNINTAGDDRQDQRMTGGIENVRNEGQRTTASGLAEAGGENISDGGKQRIAGQSSGEPIGAMAEGAVKKQNANRADSARAAIERQNTARHLRLEKISSRELGLEKGTDFRNIQVMPEENWDGEMKQVASRIYEETGKQVTYVLGKIQVQSKTGAASVRGVIEGNRIILQADNLSVPMEKIADHEAYHAKADFASESMQNLNTEIRNKILEEFSEEEFQKVLEKYIIGLRGIYNLEKVETGEEYESVIRSIEEELFADAYAGINAFGANADQFTDAVNEKMDEIGMGKMRSQDQENGTAQKGGPPADEVPWISLPKLEEETTKEKGNGVQERYSADDTGSEDSREETGAKWISLPTLEGEDQKTGFYKGDIQRGVIEEGIRKVANMESVAQISGNEFAKGETDLITQVSRFFTSMDNVAYNPQLGSVILDRNGVKDDIGHGIGRMKAASFAAVPDVLARGYVVDYQKDWKGRGYDTAVVAAPIKIGDREYLMGIVLTRQKAENRFYVHEVMTTENGALPFKTGTRKGDPSGNTPSMYSILDKIRAVKNKAVSNEKYSLDDGTTENQDAEVKNDYDKLDAQWMEEHKKDKEKWLKEKLGDTGYKAYKENRKQEETRKKQENARKRTEDAKERKGQAKARADAQVENIRKSAEKKMQESVKATNAKKDFRGTVLSLFSIPDGKRAELGSIIDSFADRIIKNGSLNEKEREAFFDKLYAEGLMTVPADEYSKIGREFLKEGRIYVPERVVSDFGDDWNNIRKRAFSAGVYLTRSQETNNVRNLGIDEWNANLSSDLPGLFDSEETDERAILERIVQVAEEGKDEKLSLGEYTARLARSEGQSWNDFLDNMERQLDWAMRTFAEKAGLEIKLKEREVKNWEKGKESSYRQMQRMAEERENRKLLDQRKRQETALRELQQKTLKQLQWLSKNRNKAPEELRATWDEVLGDIDLYAVGAANEMNWSDKYNATWKDIAQMYKDAQENDPNFLPSDDLKRIVDRLDGTKIADMDMDALQDLYKAAIGLRTEFYNRNNVINDAENRLFEEVYEDSKEEIEKAAGKFSGNPVDTLFNLEQLTPMNVIERMGGWNPDGAFYSMAKQLEKGERDMRAYTVKANRMLQDFLTENEEWVKRADGQGKDAIWYTLEVPELVKLGMGDKPIFGDTVTVYMTPAQKVHLYLESKNYDNLRHMTGGRTFPNKELYSNGKRNEAFAQGTTIRMAPETVKKIVSDLTTEEMELARLLEQYYNAFAKQEINKVSNVLNGYDKAMGTNYAPIYTNNNYTQAEFGVFDASAEGVGNLKERKKGRNPSYNISAFDAFEKHVDQTARFCGMAIPTRNWKTLLNWKENNTSMGDVITHKWGDEGKNYITDLITELQGEKVEKNDIISKGVEKLMSNYISAVFGANPSIVLKQLGSIPLASAYLGGKNMPNPAQINRIDRNLISKYTQDLEWRTMGYSMPETKQLKDNPNWTQSNKVFGFIFGGDAITAMDGWAASVLWPWAENKVRKEFPNLEIGSKEQIEKGESPFYRKVAEEFDNAVARSQSTSDKIHQSTLRKSKNWFARTVTMFRSDSAQTYNTLRQKIGEAKYYAGTGANPKILRQKKREVGAAFLSAVAGYLFAEGIEFLMNLWKHKGKKYRDEDGNLTVGSICGEMAYGFVGDMAGIVTGGEELYDLIGGIITDGNLFGIDTMGMEQLNDCLETVFNAGKKIREIIVEGRNVAENGGDLGEYFRRHGNDILGTIKDVASAVATYIPGAPVDNVEAYLIGPFAWISPGLKTKYDDLTKTANKNGLAGLKGDALTARVGSILENRKVSDSEDTAKVLAGLYEAGFKAAVPGETPDSLTVNEETRRLSPYQKQTYDVVFGSVVADGIDELVSSEQFARADQKTQAKMLNGLYNYAREDAKAELFDDYELESGAVKNSEIVAAGATVAECIAWNTITSEMKSGEKAAELEAWKLSEEAKKAIFRNKISDSKEDAIAACQDAGLSFNQFLNVYSKYSEIGNTEIKANEKAIEFSRWVDGQKYSKKQADVIKDQLKYFNMSPASAKRYDALVDSGMEAEDAYKLAGVMNSLEPEEGEKYVTNLQKWRECVDFSGNTESQMQALGTVMTDAQYTKVKIAYNLGVTPDEYVSLQEVLTDYDSDGNGSYSYAEIQSAVESIGGYLSDKKKAVLWQLASGSKKSWRNPFDRETGQKVVDARDRAKEEDNGGSFGDEVMRQLIGG